MAPTSPLAPDGIHQINDESEHIELEYPENK
ncbi:MAG: hypothetical protein RBG13Loki_3130 [Promethearchaeota archaeon CR_4]|nr:MAG: hypothetical protein RBG13Loki_3130 [Candidatus Lokiarchaeota archaeon CR_4]